MIVVSEKGHVGLRPAVVSGCMLEKPQWENERAGLGCAMGAKKALYMVRTPVHLTLQARTSQLAVAAVAPTHRRSTPCRPVHPCAPLCPRSVQGSSAPRAPGTVQLSFAYDAADPAQQRPTHFGFGVSGYSRPRRAAANLPASSAGAGSVHIAADQQQFHARTHHETRECTEQLFLFVFVCGAIPIKRTPTAPTSTRVCFSLKDTSHPSPLSRLLWAPSCPRLVEPRPVQALAFFRA